MSKCLPCSQMTGKEQDSAKYYKAVYKKTGKLYWAYRLESKGSFLFTNSDDWKIIYPRDVKPNFIHGAEFFRIDEFDN